MEIGKITAEAVKKMRERSGIRAAAARARWDQDHLVKMQCSLTLPEAASIDKICRRYGCSRYRITRSLLLALIDQEEDRPPWCLDPEDPETDLWAIQDQACEIIDKTASLIALLEERKEPDPMK